jgi:disulfide bond formation protein DsbB
VLVLLSGLAGVITAGRHLWLQTLPPDQVPSCGPGIGYLFDAFPLGKMLKLVFTGSGECAKVEPILGLPMPAWSLLWFVLLMVLAIVASRRGNVEK